MKISQMQELLEARVLCCEENIDHHVYSAGGCDLMSDVLAFVKEQTMLMTGLINSQVIRTAEMMDIKAICFVRGKSPAPEVIELANEKNIVLLSTENSLYISCGKLYEQGIRGNVGA